MSLLNHCHGEKTKDEVQNKLGGGGAEESPPRQNGCDRTPLSPRRATAPHPPEILSGCTCCGVFSVGVGCRVATGVGHVFDKVRADDARKLKSRKVESRKTKSKNRY